MWSEDSERVCETQHLVGGTWQASCLPSASSSSIFSTSLPLPRVGHCQGELHRHPGTVAPWRPIVSALGPSKEEVQSPQGPIVGRTWMLKCFRDGGLVGRDVEERRGSSGPSRTLHHHGNLSPSTHSLPARLFNFSFCSSLAFLGFRSRFCFSFLMKEQGGPLKNI